MIDRIKNIFITFAASLLLLSLVNQNTFAAEDDNKVLYDGTAICAALFIADANLEEQAGNKENVDILLNAANTLMTSAYSLSNKSNEAVDDEILGYAKTLVDMQSSGEYKAFVNEYGDACIEVVSKL